MKMMSNKKRRRRVYVGFKFPHMGLHSGYDMIRDFAGYDEIVDCQNSFEWLDRFLSGRTLISRIYGALFGHWMWWIELRLILNAIFGSPAVYHLVYAENVYRLLWLVRGIGHRVVCTYHQPAEFFVAHHAFQRGIRHLDEVILLGAEEKIFFEKFLPSNKIHVIPHGIDVEFFSPGKSKISRELLMVGNWLRNFEFADTVFKALLEVDPQIQIHIVANRTNLGKLTPDKRLHLHFGITDEELVERYRNASLVFLPLSGFVANNAVLEAAACGCPVLISTNQETPTTDSPVQVVPMDLGACLEAIMRIFDSSAEIGEIHRQWVVEGYAWPAIGARTSQVFEMADHRQGRLD